MVNCRSRSRKNSRLRNNNDDLETEFFLKTRFLFLIIGLSKVRDAQTTYDTYLQSKLLKVSSKVFAT